LLALKKWSALADDFRTWFQHSPLLTLEAASGLV
jgi:hypothetical protein